MFFDETFSKETRELLRALVRIRSTNPPGDEDEIANFALNYLEARNVSCRRVPLSEGRSSIVAQVNGREPGSIVLCGHLDTVRVEERSWTVDPFDGQITGEILWGRGACDMKAGVAVIMKLVSWVAGWSEPPRFTVTVALTADEENGFGGAQSLVDREVLENPQFLVITEPTEGRPYVGEKGALWLRVVFQGKAGHGSVPHMGCTTVLPACRYASEFSEIMAGLEPVDGRGQTTMNIGEIHGGRQINVIAAETELKIDMRLVDSAHRSFILEGSERIGRKIAAETSTAFKHEVIRYQPPLANDQDDHWISRFLEAARKVTGRREPAEIVPYATDASVLAPAFSIPHVVCGPGSIAQAHGPDEFVELRTLDDTAEIIAEFLHSSLC